MKTFIEFILECELVEGIQPLPREKMLGQIVRKSGAAHSANSFRKDYTKRGLKDLEKWKIGTEEKENRLRTLPKQAQGHFTGALF